MQKGVLGGLAEETAPEDPLRLFAEWYGEARRAAIFLPESFTLATVSADGRPSARQILLKGFDDRGFVFYTNYESRKSREIAENPRVAFVFHWPILQRQVRIQGLASRMSTQESEEYFRTRPRGSQLGAWASQQSAVLQSRSALEARFAELRERFRGVAVPLPPNWGGFRVAPSAVEFWQGRADRLHDRLLYTREGEAWTRVRLAP